MTDISKQTFNIGGFKAYVYGLDQVQWDEDKNYYLRVVYVIHHRGGSHKDSEKLALHWLKTVRGAGADDPIIALTLDIRNHGERVLDADLNEDWGKQRDSCIESLSDLVNPTHGIDMMSHIDGTADDILLAMDYLPSFLPFQRVHLVNDVIGVSLGAHIAWRVVAKSPTQVNCLIPIIGSPVLSLMMLDRVYRQVLGKRMEVDKQKLRVHGQVSVAKDIYENLMNSEYKSIVQKLWPPTLHKRVCEADYNLERGFDRRSRLTFILCGREDPLVPPVYTTRMIRQSRWKVDNPDLSDEEYDKYFGNGYVKKHENDELQDDYTYKYDRVDIYLQPGTGHECTPEMVKKVSEYLADIM